MDAKHPAVLRSWTGWIRTPDRARYTAYLEETGMSAYRATAGNLGAWAVMRDTGDGLTEVRTLSLWRSRADIVAFAGEDIATAVYYAEDDAFLISRSETVEHFDVVG